jgi:hypothetical protein
MENLILVVFFMTSYSGKYVRKRWSIYTTSGRRYLAFSPLSQLSVLLHQVFRYFLGMWNYLASRTPLNAEAKQLTPITLEFVLTQMGYSLPSVGTFGHCELNQYLEPSILVLLS